MSFTYDAFISYTRRDEAWAVRLVEELERKGLRPFRDTGRLIAGKPWDTQLQAAIQASQHLVVLWSSEAISDWVVSEIAAFQADVRNKSTGEAGEPARHVIPVYLEGDYKPLARYEHIAVIRNAGAYAAGAAAVPPAVWEAMVKKLEASIRHADDARRVPALVITTTRAALGKVPANEPLPPPPQVGESLSALIKRLGIRSRKELLASYGADRGDWRPFGSESTVKTILEQLKDDINLQLGSEGLRRFRWDYLDDEFWSATPQRVYERLKREAAIVVLDPLSLYDPAVKWMTSEHLIPQIRENDSAVVMVLPPFAMPSTASALRESIRALATEVFNSYYNPPVFSGGRYARYVTSVGDEVDLKAWLLAGIGPMLAGKIRDNGERYLAP